MDYYHENIVHRQLYIFMQEFLDLQLWILSSQNLLFFHDITIFSYEAHNFLVFIVQFLKLYCIQNMEANKRNTHFT